MEIRDRGRWLKMEVGVEEKMEVENGKNGDWMLEMKGKMEVGGYK